MSCFKHYHPRASDFKVKYEKLPHPNLLQEIVIGFENQIVSQRWVCKKCKRPVIKVSERCDQFCLKHGCLCHAS